MAEPTSIQKKILDYVAAHPESTSTDVGAALYAKTASKRGGDSVSPTSWAGAHLRKMTAAGLITCGETCRGVPTKFSAPPVAKALKKK